MCTAHHHRPDRDLVAGRDLRARHQLAVLLRAVRAPEVLDPDAGVVPREPRVLARQPRVGDLDVRRRGAPDHERVAPSRGARPRRRRGDRGRASSARGRWRRLLSAWFASVVIARSRKILRAPAPRAQAIRALTTGKAVAHGPAHATQSTPTQRKEQRTMLSGLISIAGGILAAAALIIARKPNAKDLIDKLTPYSGLDRHRDVRLGHPRGHRRAHAHEHDDVAVRLSGCSGP